MLRVCDYTCLRTHMYMCSKRTLTDSECLQDHVCSVGASQRTSGDGVCDVLEHKWRATLDLGYSPKSSLVRNRSCSPVGRKGW